MVERTYETDSIRVHWNSALCIHTAICLKALPQVFDVNRSPWVRIDAANADEVAAAVERCPTGALTYERLDGGPDEPVPAETTIIPWPNGPLMVRGNLQVRDAKGNLFEAGPRMTLCRCGSSENQPFCDLSHRRVGFRNVPRATRPERAEAQSPRDVSPDALP